MKNVKNFRKNILKKFCEYASRALTVVGVMSRRLRPSPGPNVIKLYASVIYECL
jgi:hypothetical protein